MGLSFQTKRENMNTCKNQESLENRVAKIYVQIAKSIWPTFLILFAGMFFHFTFGLLMGWGFYDLMGWKQPRDNFDSQNILMFCGDFLFVCFVVFMIGLYHTPIMIAKLVDYIKENGDYL